MKRVKYLIVRDFNDDAMDSRSCPNATKLFNQLGNDGWIFCGQRTVRWTTADGVHPVVHNVFYKPLETEGA